MTDKNRSQPADDTEPARQDPTGEAILMGAGAIAQGTGATAVGASAVHIAGPNSGNINTGNQTNINTAGGAVNFIQAGKPAPAAPYQVPPPAADHVQRSHELALLVRQLLDSAGQLLPVTVGVYGFGGFGKTTLARLCCAEPQVRQACTGGILWVPIGQNPADPRAQIADLVAALTGDSEGCATLPGARAQLAAAVAKRNILFVIDDVWDEAQMKDILEASNGCARLVTTRNPATLPIDAVLVDIGKMDGGDAVKLLGARLPADQNPRLAKLADQLGRWPVLLRLANRTLRQRVERQKTPLENALDTVERELTQKGVVAFDPERHVLERDQAVAATIEASLELLAPIQRGRYAELAIFPQDLAIPLEQAAELWNLTAALSANECETLVIKYLEPASLLDYDGGAQELRLHDVLRSYLDRKLANKGALHQRLATRWSDRPVQTDAYAWRWIAFHRAQAAMLSSQPERHDLTDALVSLVSETDWQQLHEEALHDLPALRQALAHALDAAIADDTPLGVALIVHAADALVRFNREHHRAEPIFGLARQGDLAGARRRTELLSIDDHWRQVLFLTVAWLAPAEQRDEARKLYDEVQYRLGPYAALKNLARWIRADLFDEAVPEFDFLAPTEHADNTLMEELLKRVGGANYDRELILQRGLDPGAQNPDGPVPTRGLYRESAPGVYNADIEQERTTTRYLAELDGPYLVAYAAQDPQNGMEALERYLSVYTNYNYPEYRFSTLWLMLGYVVQFPRTDGSPWVQQAVVRILASALGGGSVEFEEGLAIAVGALRAKSKDEAARTALEQQAHQLINHALQLKPGRDHEGSDRWGRHKRLMLVHAEALGWLLGERALADQILEQSVQLGDSGFAGFQAPACLALAEAVHVCNNGAPRNNALISRALDLAQSAAHNVQDPTFCARMTARVNAMRRTWWSPFNLEERARQLAQAAHEPKLAALHRVGHDYAGRRPDALELPAWAREDRSFEGLEKLYQRSKSDFLRLNGGDKPLRVGDDVAVPDVGFVPHLAARLAAEALAQAGTAPLTAERMRLLRALVPYALPSPTALDAVLKRLVLAQARSDPLPDLASALETVLARRPAQEQSDLTSELIAARFNHSLPA